MKEFRLDKLDYQIIRLMEEDCSLPYSEIAKNVNANMWTVRDRIELLKRRGIIERCKGVINHAKMGLDCDALLFVNVNPSKLGDLLSFLKGNEKVKGITIMTGQERIMINIVDETCLSVRDFIQKELMRFEIEIKEFNVILERPIK